MRADYATAYGRMAPEVRQSVTLRRFEAAARPLQATAQGHRSGLELYKLGVRIGDGGESRLFYSFGFAEELNQKPPPVLLEVTFRDTTSRGVLGFGQRVAKPASKPARGQTKGIVDAPAKRAIK